MTVLDLGALKALAEAATPGPWEAYVVPATRNETGYVAVEVGDTEVRVARYEGGYFDGAFIAAANPQTVLALIERVQAAEAVIAEVEPILALLHYRGLVDSDSNREDVKVALERTRSALSRYENGATDE